MTTTTFTFVPIGRTTLVKVVTPTGTVRKLTMTPEEARRFYRAIPVAAALTTVRVTPY